MPPMMLPTIPSGTASLRNTPPPSVDASSELPHPVLSADSLDDVSASATSLPSFGVSALASLPSSAPFSTTEQITASIAATAIGMPPGSVTGPNLMPTPAPVVAATEKPPNTEPVAKHPQAGRRRKAAASASAAGSKSAAPTQGEERYTSDSENDDNPLSSNGMPLTPDAPGSGRPGSLRHLTTDERRARRLQRNRLAAKECRQKKKAYIQNLEEQVDAIQEENGRLRKENSRLRKENEELGAKLTLSGMRASSATTTTPVLDPNHPMASECNDSMDSLSSPSLASKRPRVAVRSTSSARLQNGYQ
ncbi:hypothetical protein H4R20_007383 [Coemansia guatemalensis]|uniref:BZIP domain-containing protein n=1 Tax=Coemansia guatemalensis TaxID=2761395 RepID=A0A9W8LPA6_9FUNG|nr:hypothetical protein H4R20_007383 [Coemansia guatemalensis]